MSEVIYHKLDLPSKLLPYRKLGVEDVSVRFLKGSDERLVGELNMMNFDKKFKILLKSVLRGIEPGQLTVGDRLYIAMWIVINCYSNIYKIETTCSECFEKMNLDVDLSKLEKVELPDGYEEPFLVSLSNGDSVPMRLLRVDDLITYQDYVNKNKREDIIYKLALTIDNDDSLANKLNYLNELSTKDIGLLRAFHDDHFHGVDLSSYKYDKCPCPQEVAGETPVPFRLEMFLPDADSIRAASGTTF